MVSYRLWIFPFIVSFVSLLSIPSASAFDLLEAAELGNLEFVQESLDGGADIEMKNKEGASALYLAATKGHEEVTRYLLERGARPDIKTSKGYTPLMMAAHHGWKDLVATMADRGAEVNAAAVINVRARALPLAVAAGHTDVAQLLIEKGAFVNDFDGKASLSLSVAIEKGDPAMVELLVENGANLNPELPDHLPPPTHGTAEFSPGLVALSVNHAPSIQQPLSQAVLTGNVEIAKYLISKGAQKGKLTQPLLIGGYVVTKAEDPELLLTLVKKMYEMADLLIANGANINSMANDSPLSFLFTHPSDRITLEFIFARGADVNARSKTGVTPLMTAIHQNDGALISLLIRYGANLNVPIDSTNSSYTRWNGYTPLIMSIQEDKDAATNLLLEQKVDVNHQTDKGATALYWAIRHGREDIVKALLDLGADPDIGHPEGQTMLCLALKNRRYPIVEILVKSGADVRAECFLSRLPECLHSGQYELAEFLMDNGADVNRDFHGKPLFFNGELYRNAEAVIWLIEHGADVNARDPRGGTLLSHAAGSGNIELVNLLLAKGADPNLHDNRGITSYYEAELHGKTQIMETLVSGGASTAPNEVWLAHVREMRNQGWLPDDIDDKEITPAKLKDYQLLSLTKPPDPKYSTPEKTWELYKSALFAWDLNLARKCHVPGRGDFIQIYERLGPEKTKEIVGNMKPIHKVTADEESAKYRIERDEGGQEATFHIYFVKVNGDWKIDRY